MNRLQHRIKELEAQHEGLNAAARVLKVDPGYLSRLASGEKNTPSDKLLRKMGLRRVVWFERLAPDEARRESDDDLTPDEWQAMYTAQCYATDAWAKKAEAGGDAALLVRIADLEAALAKVNARLTQVQAEAVFGVAGAPAPALTDQRLDEIAEDQTWHDGDSPRLDHRRFAREVLAAAGVDSVDGAHAQLMKFYAVTTLDALVEAQAHHIEKLQAKLPPTPSFAPQRVREG